MGFPAALCQRAIAVCGRGSPDALVSFLIEAQDAKAGAAKPASPAAAPKSSPHQPSGWQGNTVPSLAKEACGLGLKAAAIPAEISRKEEMRRINREWNQKAEEDKRKVRRLLITPTISNLSLHASSAQHTTPNPPLLPSLSFF